MEENTAVDELYKQVYERLVEKFNKNVEMNEKLVALEQELNKELSKSTQMNKSIIDVLFDFDPNLELNPYDPDNKDFVQEKLQLIMGRYPNLKDILMKDGISEDAELVQTLGISSELNTLQNPVPLESWLLKEHPQIYEKVAATKDKEKKIQQEE